MTSQRELTAVVIGGTRGIGLQLVRHFASQGYSVALCSRDNKKSKETAREIEKEFGTIVIGMGVDVTISEQCEEFASYVSSVFGSVNVLFTSAAIFGPVGDLASLDLDRWKETITANLLSLVQPIQAFLPLLINSDNCSILTMSGGGLGGSGQIENASSYIASKAAIVALVETFAKDLGKHAITINAIAPGFFPTGFMEEALRVGRDKAGESLFRDASRNSDEDFSIALHQLTTLTDFLVSKDARNITGRILSARWDTPNRILEFVENNDDIYRLRRVDEVLVRIKNV
jgi:3-oxoacyl-[acyl-carrier protein] reductase